MHTIRDPALPLLEMQEIMGSISGRIPNAVEKAIRKQLNNYGSNITSVLCQFPAQQVSPFFLLLALIFGFFLVSGAARRLVGKMNWRRANQEPADRSRSSRSRFTNSVLL